MNYFPLGKMRDSLFQKLLLISIKVIIKGNYNSNFPKNKPIRKFLEQFKRYYSELKLKLRSAFEFPKPRVHCLLWSLYNLLLLKQL